MNGEIPVNSTGEAAMDFHTFLVEFYKQPEF